MDGASSNPETTQSPEQAAPGADWFLNESELISELRRSRITVDATPILPNYSNMSEVQRGGQGVVYSAVHVPTRRPVAIKVLHPTALTSHNARRRFEREVELAAALRHPGVVRVYDSGTTTDGRLYLTMEWIDGETLDAFAVRNSRDQRLLAEMLAKVAEALNHAHLHAVIHRDLKPSNIRLAKDGTPTILDFGLATAGTRDLSELTATGSFLGSLPWSSPEQALGRHAQIDTRTDIYSLGVVLHQLLTGDFPYDVKSDIRTALNNIAGGEPIPMRKIRTDIHEDLEVITLKCLAKDPAERYQTAADLAHDLRCYLSGEPISARRESMWNAMRRQASRFRLLAWAGALILFVASLSLVFVMRYADKAALERDRARSATATARNNINFLTAMLQGAGPGSGEPGREVRVVEILDRAAGNVDRDLADDPPTLAAMHATIGRSYAALGMVSQAEHHARRSYDVASAIEGMGPDHPLTLEYEADIYSTLVQQNRLDEATPRLRFLLARMDQRIGPTDVRTLKTRNELARCERLQGRFDEAEVLIETALGALPAGADPELTLSIRGNLAALRLDQGRYSVAEPLLREAVESSVTVRGPEHPGTLTLEHKLAQALEHLDRKNEALELWRGLVPRMERSLGTDHARVREAREGLARLGA